MMDIPTDIQDQKIPQKEIVVYEKNIDLKYHFVFSKSSILAGIIKIPSEKDQNLSYQELPKTLEDERKIEDLITSLGIHGKLTLLLHHEKRLRKLGEEVRYLHPYKFLGHIFTNPDLKAYMVNIYEDYFKRTNFVKDFSQTMDIYDLRNKLLNYLDDFANEINIPVEKLKPFIIEKDWGNFLKFLIYY